MLTQAENERLTRVGPGTAMGEMLRRYWIPAAKSSELEPDGAPVRLVLLGERLIAFRDSSGRVGVMDHRCPHRSASLFFGRNEDNGLRCVYHGWKYAVDGTCLDMPNLPPHQHFKEKVRARAYEAVERSGVVWVHMGPQDDVPAFPAFDALALAEDDTRVVFVQRACNWLQAMEGDIDTSHFNFLHAGSDTAEDYRQRDPLRYGAIHRDPEYVVDETRYGTVYGAYRPADPGNLYWRVAHFVYPFWTLPPFHPFEHHVLIRGWVPIDDEHTMYVSIGPNAGAAAVNPVDGLVANDTGWYGRWRMRHAASDDYGVDRDAQRNTSFTGIPGIHLQDQAITESMGAILDRSWEHLAPSDRMVATTRRNILMAARALERDGAAPPGSTDPELCRRVRAGYFVAPKTRPWPEVYDERLAAVRAAPE